jgi:hypothetical protein
MTYAFVERTRCNLSGVRALGDVAMSQVRETLQIRRGEAFDTFEDCVRAARELFDDDDPELVRYDVVSSETKTPTHEMWIYLEEHGVVFEHDQPHATPVCCVQRHFFSTDESDPAALALAKALNATRW